MDITSVLGTVIGSALIIGGMILVAPLMAYFDMP